MLLRFWADLGAPIDRRTYVLHGLGLAVVKYAGDVALVWLATGQVWTPTDYLQSVYSLVSMRLAGSPSWLLPALGVWTLPFVWLGVTLSIRRALDAGRSCWWAFMFFVPYANYALMAALAVLPGATPAPADAPPRDGRLLVTAILSITAGASLGLLALAIMVTVFRAYTAALFFGAPFAMGAITSFLFNRQYDASGRQTAGVTVLMFAVGAGLAFLLATEGVVCILMALPLALVTGLSGALLGRVIALMGQRDTRAAFFALIALPLSAGLEPGTGRIIHEVRTAVVVDAQPEQVWPHVIAFRPIEKPADLVFRLGIAYPEYAWMSGEGAGAIRYCVFSTGAFVEPITHWEVGRRLSFDVVDAPAPLRELTIYTRVAPPHLDGYLRSKRGEFRLVPLPGGRTRLEGSTWYELEMAPEGYWQVLSDYLIQRIHRRVLDHIKDEVETF